MYSQMAYVHFLHRLDFKLVGNPNIEREFMQNLRITVFPLQSFCKIALFDEQLACLKVYCCKIFHLLLIILFPHTPYYSRHILPKLYWFQDFNISSVPKELLNEIVLRAEPVAEDAIFLVTLYLLL